MRRAIGKKLAGLVIVLTMFAALVAPLKEVSAHGGEDHGDSKAEAVPAGANMTARVVRVGDYEVTIKHPNLEPDKETVARMFVTRFATNEPVKDAKIVVVVDDAGSSPAAEVAATATATPGLYEVKLPPMAQGETKLSARVEVNGTSMVANYGAMQVAMPETAVPAAIATWARTVLLGLALLVGLGLIGILIYFAIPIIRRGRIKGEATTAA